MANTSPIQRLIQAYIGGLILIALASISGYWLLTVHSQRLDQYDQLLNTTHQQQIRAQQIALLANELALFADASQAASLRAELHVLRDELWRTHQRLLADLPADVLDHTTTTLERFLTYVDNLTAAPPALLSRDNIDLRAIQTNLIVVQSDLSATSSILLMQSQTLRSQIALIQAGVVVLILSLLIAGVFLIIRPYARRARYEAEQLRMLSLVARYTDNAVIITDRTGRIEWVNEGFTRISGYTLDEARGKKPGELLQGPETDQETVAAISQAVRNGEPIKTEILNYTKDGHPYWLSLDISPVYDEQHHLTHFIAIESDITHQKEMERMLRSALKESRDIMNALDQSAILSIADPEGRILEVNERFCAITGYRPDELIGKDHRIFKSGVHPPEFF
ncbi:MAG: PAS domain S-box protein, partial [Chloroflexi bacterium]